MQDDALFFLLIGVGFFVLWAVTGGPTRPISFAGAFITPITNVDSKQVGYGPKIHLGESVSVGGTDGASISAHTSDTAPANNDSMYRNQINVGRAFSYFPADPGNAYVHLIVSSNAITPVSISHWRFKSVANNAMVIISNSDASLAPNTSTTVLTTFPSNSQHDTITLEDSVGRFVSSFSY